MQAIIDTDPDETDIEDRTINYFVDAYIARFSAGYEKQNLHRRLIFDLDDSDVDDDGNTMQTRVSSPHTPSGSLKISSTGGKGPF
jgi:hypothetical protein